MLLFIIASAKTLIDKSLQGFQARLNDRLYKKQGHGGHWKTSALIALHCLVFFLFLFCFFHNEPFTGSAVMMAASLLAICLLMFLMVG